MNQKGFANIILVAIIIILASLAGYFTFVNKTPESEISQETNIHTNTQQQGNQETFPEITECVMGVQVDFSSNSKVNGEQDVEQIFMTFIENSKKLNKPVFSSDYGNTWKFNNTNPYGTYKGLKYWKVDAQWYSTDDNQWRDKSVFYVSENGEVTRLLGCI